MNTLIGLYLCFLLFVFVWDTVSVITKFRIEPPSEGLILIIVIVNLILSFFI